MEQYQDINDVKTLKAMLVTKQQQLAQLQAVTGSLAATKKRKVSSTHRSEEAELLGSESEGVPLDKDDENWDPSCDSDYDDAPKKKRSSSSSSKKSAGPSKKQKQSTIDAAYNGRDMTAREQDKTAKAAVAALKSIKSAITQQMVYKKSLKHGTSRVSLELPCLTEPIIATMLGPQLLSKATNDKKQLQLKATDDDLGVMYPNNWGAFSKSLRYGATLGLVAGLTFTFNKESGTLKVHGSYTMMR